MSKRWQPWMGSVLLLTACGVDGGSGGGTAGPSTGSGPTAGPSGSEGSGGSGPSGPGGDATDTGSGEDASASGADSTAGGSETGVDTGGPAGLEVEVLPSSVAVLEADEMGMLTVGCQLLDGGAPVPEPGTFTVSLSPDQGYDEAGGVYTFPEAGLYEATCAIDHEGQRVEGVRTVAVLNEAIDPAMAEIGAGMSQALGGIFEVIASNEQADQLLFDAVVELDASLPLLQSARVTQLNDVLRLMPGGYPTGPEIEALGIMPNGDDEALPAALDQLDAALLAFETTLAGSDPTGVDEAPLMALEADLAAFEAAVAGLSALEPSAHGLMAQRERVAGLVRERMQPSLHAAASYLSERVHAEAELPFHFGLLGLTLGMFNQSYLRVKLVNEWYGDYIAQLDESINNFILAGALDIAFPPSADGPVIDLLQASASVGFATPGYPSWIDGQNFDELGPEFNLVLVFGDSWQGIVDNIISGCGIEQSDSIPEAVEKFVDCVAEIEGAVDSIFWTPVSVGPGLFGSEQGLDMGPFPEACAGGLPTATFLLPLTWQGRGPSYFINCI